MVLRDALGESFDYAGEVVASVRDDQLSAPTPCSEWDVGGLATTVLDVAQSFITDDLRKMVGFDPPISVDPVACLRRPSALAGHPLRQ